MLLAGCEHAVARNPGKPAVPVTVEPAVVSDVPVEIDVVGNVVPIAMVDVKSRVDGQIERVSFREGQDVRRGQQLFRIDPRPYRIALDEANTALARDMAQLHNAEREDQRYGALFEQKLVPAQQRDQASTQLETSRATVQSDRNAIENAHLNLAYTEISAPINGRTGSLQVTAGNLVKANSDPPLVVIRQISPVYVSFAVPAERLPEVRAQSKAGSLQVTVVPHGQGGAPRTGTLTFIDNAVDTATGTIGLKATFANEDEALWPGQFVDVSVRLRVQKNAVVVPARAVQAGQRGQYVFVVGADHKVESRDVETGIGVGDRVVVTRGVRGGERVVTDGQLNLVAGTAVEIKPAGSEEPSTGDSP